MQNNILKGVCGGSAWPFLLYCLMLRSCLQMFMAVGTDWGADYICAGAVQAFCGETIAGGTEAAGGAGGSKL